MKPQSFDRPFAVLDLDVRNHPGVMTHVCGLFARRGWNVEGILCLPAGDGGTSKVYLKVADSPQMEQMILQARKLHDVLGVRRHETGRAMFAWLEEFFTGFGGDWTESSRAGKIALPLY